MIDDNYLTIAIEKLKDFRSFCSQHSKEVDVCKDFFQKRISSHVPLFFLEWNESNVFYRLCDYIDDGVNDITKVKTFSYKPFDKECNIGRLNLPNQSVFYAGQHLNTCIDELKLSNDEKINGKELYISEWKLKEKHKLRLISFVCRNLLDLVGYAIEQEQRIEELFIHKIQGFFPMASLTMVRNYYKELCMIISGESYLCSAIIANYIYSCDSVDGILYDSVQTLDKIVGNVAIKPNAVDEHMELTCVKKGELRENENGHRKIAGEIMVAHERNGALIWHTIKGINHMEITSAKYTLPDMCKLVNYNKSLLDSSIVNCLNTSQKDVLDNLMIKYSIEKLQWGDKDKNEVLCEVNLPITSPLKLCIENDENRIELVVNEISGKVFFSCV